MGTERFSLLANRITNLVGQYRAETQLETRAEQQERVAELGQQALSGLELGVLFGEVVGMVSETLGNEVAEILAYRAESNEFVVREGVGRDDEMSGSPTISVTDDLQVERTLEAEEPIVVDSESDAHWNS